MPRIAALQSVRVDLERRAATLRDGSAHDAAEAKHFAECGNMAVANLFAASEERKFSRALRYERVADHIACRILCLA